MRKYIYFTLFVFVIIWRDAMGEDIQSPEGDDLCAADVTVGSGRKVIKTSTEEEFQVYCRLHDGFKNVELKVKGNKRVYQSLNFSDEYYNINVDGTWQPFHVKLDYEYHSGWVTYYWLLNVSINNYELKSGYIDWGRFNEDLVSIELIAYGQSEWRFAKPGEDCPSLEDDSLELDPGLHSTEGPDSNGDMNMWILVGVIGAVVLLGILAVIILVYKIRHPKDIVLPRVNLDTENENEYEDPPYRTGDRSQATRPGSSHDSENSLYGIL
ncbi:uncharacterized protein [Palaemon carinicauda]|uniref:uncharacterized protein isoform X2 n=1 Tax=Palaemon carinicauda TaxID=392227 RepID=UPI0035B58E89